MAEVHQCRHCRRVINIPVKHQDVEEGDGFVKGGGAKYVVTDDLSVSSKSSFSSLAYLNTMHIVALNELEEKVVNVNVEKMNWDFEHFHASSSSSPGFIVQSSTTGSSLCYLLCVSVAIWYSSFFLQSRSDYISSLSYETIVLEDGLKMWKSTDGWMDRPYFSPVVEDVESFEQFSDWDGMKEIEFCKVDGFVETFELFESELLDD
ncbi:hypothetical protein L6452_14312 [Arctium lappa]|uniref:Uncharacterized protein n=1 Tax=Arctium lappa TaxID=4217 RepID=A0ACB9CKQ1_ARCLA|nr:hypothetical protein L6452_14312 [Arctium lappa]